MEPHWTEAYYGALYLDTVDDLLTPALSEIEAHVVASLLALGAGERVLDLACGQGRHARALAGKVRAIVGVDRSAAYLRRARGVPGATPTSTPRYVQGDLRRLPFGPATFDAAYSWYASLFMFDDAENAAALGELARVVRPGGRLLVHHANPLALAQRREETARRTLADGSVIEEESVFDPDRGVDRCTRRLVRPGGDALEATAYMRYYTPSEWRTLARAAGLRLVRVTSTTDAAARGSADPGPEAPDLIALLEKPT